MIPRVERAILERWRELGFHGPKPARVSFFLSSGVAGKHGKVLYHAFRDGDPRPLFLGKIPRNGSARSWCLHEDHILHDLAEAAPHRAGVLFPRPLLFEQDGERIATGQTILPGVPMDRRAASLGGGQGAARTLYNEARGWLKEFWGETALLEASEGALWERFLRAAHYYLEAFDPDPGIRAEIESLIVEMESRRGKTSLCAFGHGDFLVTNIIVDGDRVGAVDWEFGEKRQFPWVDPIHFAIDYSLRLGHRREGSRLVGFERGFFEDGWLRELNRNFLGECFSEGGVSIDSLPLVLPAHLLACVHRMASFFSTEYRVTKEWRAIAERCLRDGARQKLVGVAA
jgi:hypothetical protein